MFLSLPDPDPSLFVRIRVLTSTSKKERKGKTLFSTLLCLLFDFSSLKAYVNVPSKTKAGSGSVIQCYGSADRDPYQHVTDPQHCVFLKNFGNDLGEFDFDDFFNGRLSAFSDIDAKCAQNSP
jgi:hypothetical protein